MQRINFGRLPKAVCALTACAAVALGAGPGHAMATPFGDGEIPERAPRANELARTEGPPNVIVILADDIGVEPLALFGGSIETPNLARLTKEGVLFERAFSTPLCSPSRTRIMTGRENASNYEAFGYLAPDAQTFGNMFRKAGFETAIVGKWQLSGNGFDGREGISPQGAGFSHSLLWQLQPRNAKGSRYWGPTLWTDGKPLFPEEGFGPDYLSDYALDFIDQNKRKPFFLYYPMVLVHDPFVVVPGKMDLEGDQAKFRGMVQHMDMLVGRLLDKVDSLGLRENTLIIFTSDNGTNRAIYSIRNGEQVRGGKGQPTLTGTHVPMIMSWPGELPAGESRQGLVDFTDIVPTIAQAAEIEPDWKIDGVSQLAVARGSVNEARSAIYQHYAPSWVFKPVKFAFDSDRKLYSDGRYVSLDLATGIERTIDADSLSGARREQYLQLKAMIEADPVPLDPVRFPWCVGQAAETAGADPQIVGCGFTPNDIPDGPPGGAGSNQ